MAEHTINFVEGEGISIQSSLDVHQEVWNVEIANTVGGQIDAKGDLVAGTGDDTAGRLPTGTDGQVLTVDSTTDTGLAWATGGGGVEWEDTGTGAAGGCYMPLTTVLAGTPDLVWDADNNLIPTLTPF